MADPKKTADAAGMSAAEAAKRVTRPVPEKSKDGEITVKQVAVRASEVLAFKDYGTYVVVVTNDGQKFSDRPE